MGTITVYGASWCEDTEQTREHLDARGIPYRYVDIDLDEDAKRRVEQLNFGRQKTPTVLFDDDPATKLVEPTNDEIDAALQRAGYAT